VPCQLPAQGPPRSRHSRVSLSANCGTKVPRRRKPDRRHKRSAGHADRLEPLQTLAGRACCHFASHCHPAGVLNSGGERRNVVANQLWLFARSVIGPPQSTPRTSQVAWLQLNLRGRSRGKYCQSPAYPADRALPPSDRPNLARSLTDLRLLRHVSATWSRPARATEQTEPTGRCNRLLAPARAFGLGWICLWTWVCGSIPGSGTLLRLRDER